MTEPAGRHRRGVAGRVATARTHALSDVQVLILTVVVALAAWWSPAVSPWVAVAVLVVTAVFRRPAMVILTAGLLAACLGARAWQGDRPAAPGPFSSTATLVDDPQDVAGAVVAEVRARGHHFEVWAHGQSASVLADRQAGQRIQVQGRVAPRPPDDDLDARRHVVGVVTAAQLIAVPGDGPLVAGVNALRGVLLAGARPLSADQRSLYGGFVLGDVRGQSPVVADDFRGSGLSHLLVVSGENVAFVVAVAGPLLRRLGPRARWVATVAVLIVFAALTRFEPSVLRATAMALIGVTAWSLGRPASGLRVLGLAVTALLLIDPMLVGVAGFQLSVAASAGIIVAARPLAEQLPLPGWLARPAAVTLAAQVAVSPILIAFYGGLPVATLPANLLAEPAAGLLMGWGMTAGALAGLVGGHLAAVLQLPAGALVWWVESVARWGAAVPLGQIGAVGLALGAALAWMAVRAGRRGRARLARASWLGLVGVLAWPGLGLALVGAAAPAHLALGRSGELWTGRSAGRPAVLVLGPRPQPRDLLDGLRGAGIGRLDLVVVPTGSATGLEVVAQLARRVAVRAVWTGDPVASTTSASGSARRAAALAALGVVQTPERGWVERIGDLVVTVAVGGPRLAVTVSRVPGVGSAGAAVARAPPLRRDPSSPGHGHPQPHP
jgi:competence protein ComEC